MTSRRRLSAALLFTLLVGASAAAQPSPAKKPAAPASPLDQLHQRLDTAAEAALAQVVPWRRELHAHPELGNRE
ncbi:MAG: amidohydrolase, partial [Acidobacteria bacterium]|nr:amidohydrolase [Acidobacteriota bacterium]